MVNTKVWLQLSNTPLNPWESSGFDLPPHCTKETLPDWRQSPQIKQTNHRSCDGGTTTFIKVQTSNSGLVRRLEESCLKIRAWRSTIQAGITPVIGYGMDKRHVGETYDALRAHTPLRKPLSVAGDILRGWACMKSRDRFSRAFNLTESSRRLRFQTISLRTNVPRTGLYEMSHQML